MDTSKKLTLKLLVDKEKNKVVLAESDKDFVDVLFSFLTLPMGTIIRRLGKQSALGSFDQIYKSVEDIDTQYMQTKACKAMLLQPINASGRRCEDLVVSLDDTDSRMHYRCPNIVCCIKTHRLYSSVEHALCACGRVMDKTSRWEDKKEYKAAKGDGVFVQGLIRFIISDDLHVTQACSPSIITLLRDLHIRDGSILQEIAMTFGTKEILDLLKKSLLSSMPLTDMCFQKQNEIAKETKLRLITRVPLEAESNASDEIRNLKLKLILIQSINRVAYAEVGGDFVDLLFSFLTFPLGSIVKLLNKQSSMGCVDNLYMSVEDLSTGDNFMRSTECSFMLLDPKLPPYFGCSKNLLRITEGVSAGRAVPGCDLCYNYRYLTLSTTHCNHGVQHATVREVNPKLTKAGTDTGGRFMKEAAKFMVTDQLVVTPFSPLHGIQIINDLKAPIGSLEERDVLIGEFEALNLLKACLISQTVLSDVFLGKRRRKFDY